MQKIRLVPLVYYFYAAQHDGMVWYGMVWYGMVWYGMVWYGMNGLIDMLH